MNLVEIINKHKDDRNTALICDEQEIKYYELYKRVVLVAEKSYFRKQVVGLKVNNSIECVVELFALWLNQNTVIMLDSNLTELEYNKILSFCNAQGMIEFNNHETKITIFDFQFNKNKNMENIAVIIPTSGTTSSSKFINISHSALIKGVECTKKFSKRNEYSRDLILLSLVTRTALEGQLLVGLYLGEVIVLNHYILNPRKIVNLLLIHNITHINVVPSILRLIVKYIENQTITFESLEMFIVVGENIDNILCSKFYMNFKDVILLYGYGLTETGPIVFGEIKMWKNDISVGNINHFPEVYIQEKKIDENIYEIMVKSEMLMEGYYGCEAESFVNGWFSTGDLGRITKDGELIIIGRIKNIINCAGKKIYPEEVEDLILQSGYIEEVLVKGEKDKLVGEKVVAYVVAKKGKKVEVKEIKSYCKGKISEYKIPCEIYSVKNIEKNINGKKIRYHM